MLEPFVATPRVAYFSMEIALKNEIPTYSGGLGILAGDTLRASADLRLPLIAVTLVHRAGYFRQEIDAAGRQIEHADLWQPERFAAPLPAKVAVSIEGREVWIRGWLYTVGSKTGGQVPVILLDTDLPENSAADRTLTDHLYGGDNTYRLKQEVVLGIGGAKMLQALGVDVFQYHLNEGHSVLLTLELLRRFAHPAALLRGGESRYDIPHVRSLCNFTTHTPVEAGHDQFPYPLVNSVMGDYFDLEFVQQMAGHERLNMTRLALNLSLYVNGVAPRHAETSRHMFPGYEVRAISNGVHSATWTAPSFAALYDVYFPGWCHDPELLIGADRLPPHEVWAAHQAAKRELLHAIATRTGVTLNPEVMTIGFARRMTAYKRPELLFSDLPRLQALAAQRPLQILFSGKAHPRDEAGKQSIAQLHDYGRQLADTLRFVFLPNYDMATALAMVAGVDLWLNTPLPPMEASGTSGMKAALNGVPNLSVLDGWWVEGFIDGVTGWAIGALGARADAASLYQTLEQTVLPMFYEDRAAWIGVMKGAIGRNGSHFNAHRMMRRYAADAYLR